MSYPNYPPQYPSYPAPPNLPYSTDPTRDPNNPNYGFPSQYPLGQQQQPAQVGFNAYPSVGPFPAYPSAQFPNATPAYPPMQHPSSAPYPSGQAPYPTGQAPYPSGQAPYPTGQAPYPTGQASYPAGQAPYPTGQAPYPPGAMGQQQYNPSAVGGGYQAPYPTQHAAPPAQQQQPMSKSNAYPVLAVSQTQSTQAYASSTHSSMSVAAAIPEKKMVPTIRPHEPFSAQADAEALRKAMKGFGTDEKAIISVLAFRTNHQRLEIAAQYKTSFGKDLIKDLKSELGGKFEDVVVAAMTPLPEYLARELHDAMAGMGTNEDTLVEVLCTLNNAWIHAINAQYVRLYNTKLENDIKGDTSGCFQRLLVSLCQGRRDENPVVNMGAATADAHALFQAGEGKLGTDESTFNMVLVSRSLPQLRQIFLEYEKLSGKPFENAVKSEFSGSIETGLLAIVKSVRNCPEYFADRLHSSLAGMGTNDRALIRIITTRAEFDLGDIKQAFQIKYKKTLASFVEGDCSGDYKKMLLAMIS